LGHALQRLTAQPPPDKCPKALVPDITPSRKKKIHRHPELPRPGEEGRSHEGPELRGSQKLKAVRERVEPAAEDDKGAAKTVIGPDQPIFHAEPPAESQRPRLLREEGVGAALDEKAVATFGLDRASEAVGGFEEGEIHRTAALARKLHRSMGGRKPCDPAADHDELHLLLLPERPRLTRSASISIKTG
jgi:hypothetical protein